MDAFTDLKSRGEISETDVDWKIKENKSQNGLKRYDLGCGANKKDGFIGVDHVYNEEWKYPKEKFIGQDLDHDVWNIPTNSVIELYCSHFIEHVKDIKAFMEECYRILAPGGIITFIAPYYTSIRAFQDYTHVRPISENTFIYFNKKWMNDNKLDHYNVKCDFDIKSIEYIFTSEYAPRSMEAREYARVHYLNTVSDIIVVLTTNKK